MGSSRLNKRTFLWAQTKRNFLSHISSFMEALNVGHLLTNETGITARDVATQLNPALDRYFQEIWINQVNRTEAICGSGQNKLRTYRTLKEYPCSETYVCKIMPKKRRSAMAKIRSGTAPLRLETGRYERPVLLPEARICHFCQLNETESEEHCLIRCTQHSDIRTLLFQSACDINESFVQKSDTEKLVYLLSQPDMCHLTAKAICDILEKKRNILY